MIYKMFHLTSPILRYSMVISWRRHGFQMVNHHIMLWLTLIQTCLTVFQLCSQQLGCINITKNIRKALDDGNIDCGVFIDFQKAFDTVDHQILLEKLNHYKICGVSKDGWLKSYLSNSQSVHSYKWIWIWSCCNKLWHHSRICSRTPSILLYVINDLKGYLRCKIKTSQNVSSEAQVKDCFTL